MSQTVAQTGWIRPVTRPVYGSLLIGIAYIVLAATGNFLLAAGLAGGAVLFSLLRHEAFLVAVLVSSPFLFAFDRYQALVAYEVPGYRQIAGAGVGIYLAMGVAAWGRLRLTTADRALLTTVFLVTISLSYSSVSHATVMFSVNTVPAVAAYFAGRRVTPIKADMVLDAVVLAAVAAVAGRWLLEGPGVSESQWRAGTNWYLGAAVYSGLPLVLAWGLTLPTLWRRGVYGLRIPLFGRVALLLMLSAELAFQQRKASLVAVIAGGYVVVRATRWLTGSIATIALRRLTIGFVLVVLSLSVYVLVESRTAALYGRLWGNESDTQRVETMASYSRALAEAPLGFGFGDSAVEFVQSGSSACEGCLVSAHNTFLSIASDAGIAAALAFLVFLVACIRLTRAWRPPPGGSDWWVRTRCGVAGVAILVEVLTNGPALYREFPVPSAGLTALFVGTLIACASKVGKSRGDAPHVKIASGPRRELFRGEVA